MHGILSQLSKITPVNLDTCGSCSVITIATNFMHYQIWMLAISATLRLRTQRLIAWLEALGRACGAALLRLRPL